eukprot:TRINITY_DN4086_c0_g1_i2.p1 TRINITY_DN4086_c0_g1~~TRINITY_DN4086_c0_g1_i2.p1  ORF type:complete len:510 (+),score=106.70 TRINITY_DN4086_c0_g1_i2:40-1569(+)
MAALTAAARSSLTIPLACGDRRNSTGGSVGGGSDLEVASCYEAALVPDARSPSIASHTSVETVTTKHSAPTARTPPVVSSPQQVLLTARVGLCERLGVEAPLPPEAGRGREDRSGEFAQLVEMFRPYTKYPHKAPSLLRRDREVILRVLREHKDGWKLLRHTVPSVRGSRDMMLAALRGRGAEDAWRALHTAPAELRADEGVVLEAVKQGGPLALEAAAPNLRSNADLMLTALIVQYESTGRTGKKGEVPVGTMSEEAFSSMLSSRASVGGGEDKDTFDKLRKQAKKGVTLKLDEAGNLSRQVPLTLLHLQRHDGFMLVRVGLLKGPCLDVNCRLPGQKHPPSMEPKEAMEKHLNEKFCWWFSKEIQPLIQRWEIAIEEKRNEAAALNTRYVKSMGMVPTDPEKMKKALVTDHRGPSSARSKLCHRLRGVPSEKFGGHLAPDFYRFRRPDAPKDQELSREIYAWLPKWEFEWITESLHGKEAIVEWLQCLDLPVVNVRRNELAVDLSSA